MDEELQRNLKKLDNDIKKQLESIPENVLTTIMDRAYKDAQKLFDDNNQDNFKQVTYYIYRAYILGMLVEKMNVEKINNTDEKIIRNNIISFVK